MTQTEFAITAIKTLTLPNSNIENDILEWQTVGLEIKPLQLILEIIKELYEYLGQSQAFITPFELQKIIIPLAGDKAILADYVEAIDSFRKDKLDISLFPDCAPRSNDERMVREFLLFLSHYGFVQLQKGKNNALDRFFLQSVFASEIDEITAIKGVLTYDHVLDKIRENPVILDTERLKVLAKVLSRPQQPKFRKQVLNKFDSTCLLTGEKMNLVLEACHIIPVEHRGSDTFNNGLCLRADLHILFDSKHIRFRPDGLLEYSEVMQNSVSYAHLPQQISIPNFVSQEALNWRYEYY